MGDDGLLGEVGSLGSLGRGMKFRWSGGWDAEEEERREKRKEKKA